jgi:hypothetical protein
VKFTKHRIHATFRLPEKTSSIAKMTNYLSGRAKHLLGCIRLSNGSQFWGGIWRRSKNPAVAAAGRMTRKSFRRLVQEETVSDGESTRLGIGVSTRIALRHCADSSAHFAYPFPYLRSLSSRRLTSHKPQKSAR